jgi:hypothetical protein
MEVTINGKALDITLESEKTAGEVLAGIQRWLEGSGLLMSGVEINGKKYGAASLDEAFELSLDGLFSMDITTSSQAALMLEALTGLKEEFDQYEFRNKEDPSDSRQRWEESTHALFLAGQDPDLYHAVKRMLGENATEDTFLLAGNMLAERIREIEDPFREIAVLHPLVLEIAQRLEDLPLDMQTGKDSRARETFSLFSALAEKIFRLIFLFSHFGTNIKSIPVVSADGTEKQNLDAAIGEFSATLKELIAAWENRDTILVGDLAEYELAPRLRCLASALCEINPGGNLL